MTIEASIIGSSFVVVMLTGKTHTINQDHANYESIREALKNKDHVLVEKLINVADAMTNYVAGRVRVVGDQVFYGDLEVKGSVVQRIIAMLREGFDAQPMINFLDNLMRNPSKTAVDELYLFLEATALPITDDGCFLAYKKVRDDYLSFHDCKTSNKIGEKPEMPRNQVDDVRDRTCSQGLHFCSLSYLPYYYGGQGRVMIVKINPADVVSIPSDYNNAKGRAWTYEIIGEHTDEHTNAFTSPVYRDTVPIYPDDDITDDDDIADDDYETGYAAGVAQAVKDCDELQWYDDKPPTNRSDYFKNGYLDGYGEAYGLDWEEVGYRAASKSVDDNTPYDDTVPAGCTSDCGRNEYRVGYANGWRDAKLSHI